VASSLATVSLINELIHPYFKVTIILDLCVVCSLGYGTFTFVFMTIIYLTRKGQ